MLITLRVRGVDLDAPAVDEVISREFPESMWASAGPVQHVTLALEADVVLAATTVVRTMCQELPEVQVLGVHRDLVGVVEIAARLGVSAQEVREWVDDGEGFPIPFDYLEASELPVWAWAEVDEWLRVARSVDLGERLPSVGLMSAIEAALLGGRLLHQ